MYEITPELSISYILSKVTQEELWCKYLHIDIIEPGKLFLSPLRDEKTPSANLFYSAKGDLLFKDFGGEALTIWGFLKLKFNTTFQNVLQIISNDFNLNNIESKKVASLDTRSRPSIRSFTRLDIEITKWTKGYLQYWEQYHISKQTLLKFKVVPIKNAWLNNNLLLVTQPAFSYEFGGDLRKIYCPEAIKELKQIKFLSNVPGHIYSGYSQLPWVGELLFITKSHKDVMVWHELGYNSIAPQGEGHKIEQDFLTLLQRRFATVILNYDNDRAGKQYASKINLPTLFINDEKDISDYIKKYGFEQTRQYIAKLIIK